MRIWLYGRNDREIRLMSEYCERVGDTVVGSSLQEDAFSYFPQSGLTRPMQAAIRGELDQLLIFDLTLLGSREEQIKAAFRGYQVSIKSACSSDSSSS